MEGLHLTYLLKHGKLCKRNVMSMYELIENLHKKALNKEMI